MENRKLILSIVTCLLTGCFSTSENKDAVTFEFKTKTKPSEVFTASTSDAEVISKLRAELKQPYKSRTLHLIGQIKRDKVDNPNWSWAYEHGWKPAELSTEVCDATPSYVENNLDEWLSTVGNYCPWSARVNKEMN